MLFMVSHQISAQKREISGPVFIDSAKSIPTASFSSKKFRMVPPEDEFKIL